MAFSFQYSNSSAVLAKVGSSLIVPWYHLTDLVTNLKTKKANYYNEKLSRCFLKFTHNKKLLYKT